MLQGLPENQLLEKLRGMESTSFQLGSDESKFTILKFFCLKEILFCSASDAENEEIQNIR